MLFVQQGGQGLVDEEADAHIQQALEQGKGDVEHQQAVEEGIAGGDVGDGAMMASYIPMMPVMGRP